MIYITIVVDPRRAQDIIGIKECLAMDAEKYGCVVAVDVKADAYEQTRMKGD